MKDGWELGSGKKMVDPGCRDALSLNSESVSLLLLRSMNSLSQKGNLTTETHVRDLFVFLTQVSNGIPLQMRFHPTNLHRKVNTMGQGRGISKRPQTPVSESMNPSHFKLDKNQTKLQNQKRRFQFWKEHDKLHLKTE